VYGFGGDMVCEAVEKTDLKTVGKFGKRRRGRNARLFLSCCKVESIVGEVMISGGIVPMDKGEP
jgi:hypothetical protein